MTWDNDDDFNFEMSDEENEEYEREEKKKEEYRMNHPITKQGEEVYRTVRALVESISDEGARNSYGSILMESAMIIPAKIAGAFGSESWLLMMQNAAIIRSHAEYLLTATSGMKYEEMADLRYVQLMREEMTRFRTVFVEWVKEIHQMEEEEYVDEWGLFIRKA
ncbi:MAG TPA: hypothetical protein VI731_12395 [Bacteroidia bacterium]|nr:hypothetical protein [Bacteroidia bacterium]